VDPRSTLRWTDPYFSAPNDEAQTPRWGRSHSETFSKLLRVTEVVCSVWFGVLCVDGSLMAEAPRANS